MGSSDGWIETVFPFVPSAVTVALIFVILFIARFFLERRRIAGHGRQLGHQLVMVGLTFFSLIAIIITLPLRDATKGQLVTLLGILVTAAIALSSTTFVGNAMAGIMLRAVRNFRTGDFITVGDHFGRVSERGLFHTEIQTEDRDLTTLPNLYLVSTPVRVMRSSGTILSITVSLGYDAQRTEVERLLLDAGRAAGLEEPFVQVLELGDFSVTYRLAGLLTQIKQVLSTRSRLRCMAMDHLHEGGIEIVSPSFMKTRAFSEKASFIPRRTAKVAGLAASSGETTAESLAFDKAEHAESLEQRGQRLADEIKEAKERLKSADSAEARDRIQRELDRLKALNEELAEAAKKKNNQDS
jgi:small-conductance mechanosensitive channel